MRRTKKSRSGRNGPENLSDMSAWLYTDLLLGLAVAFLGAGTFLVKSQSDASGAPAVLTYQLSCNEVVFEVPSNITPQSLDNLAINSIDNASIIEGWNEPKVGILQIFGGARGGTVSEGRQTADLFRDATVSNTPILNNAEKLTFADNSLSRGRIKLRIYIVYKGEESKNGC